jgi:hypothetical protein
VVKLAVAMRDIISNESASPGFDSRPMHVSLHPAFGLVKLLLGLAETNHFSLGDDRFCSEVTPICLDEGEYSLLNVRSRVFPGYEHDIVETIAEGYKVSFPRFRCIRILAYCTTKDRSQIVHNTIIICVVSLCCP